MFSSGDQVQFYADVMALDVVMTVRYALSTAAGGEVTYLCCYQDDNHTIQNITVRSSELTIVP